MIEKLMGWLSGVYMYVIAGLAGLCVLLMTTTWIQGHRMHSAKTDAFAAKAALSISNDSIKDLQKSLTDIQNRLDANAKAEKRKQRDIQDDLRKVRRKNQQLGEMVKDLNSRVSTQPCETPKDLKDAWQQL